MITVAVASTHPWALLPYRESVDISGAKATAGMYEKEFRWVRRRRVAELCGPWRLARQLGWVVPSPVDVTMSPVRDLEVGFEESDLGEAARVTGRAEMWAGERGQLAVDRTDWLRLYQFAHEGGWRSMFVPNGQGTVEWYLGFTIEPPPEVALLVLPHGPLEVPMGVLAPASLRRVNASGGLAIAVRPRKTITIARGEPVARLVPLPIETLKAVLDSGTSREIRS